MNRGLQFFTPTAAEWYEYNDRVLNRRTTAPSDRDADTPSGVYISTNSMPAFVLNLTRPNLNWCIDSGLLSRHETKINIGSSYFVMDKCILGPKICCWDASVDKRASTYIESFAKEVTNGLRWILQIYRTTNVMQQHDLFNTDLAIAKNMRNKLAFGSYTPVRLVTPLKDGTDCEEVSMSTADESPFFVQPFGFCSGNSAPIGNTGQFTRPYLGAAPVTGFCSTTDPNEFAVRDPYDLNASDVKRLNEMISRNREEMVNRSYGIFKPTSGVPGNRTAATPSVPVFSASAGTNFQQDALPSPAVSSIQPPSTQAAATGIPQPPNPSNIAQPFNELDMDMDDTMRDLLGV